MKTYWNGDGKYQDWYDKIADTMPSMYDTDNSNMNLFIYMSRLYYDIYNNGGANVSDSKKYQKEIDAVASIVKKFRISKVIIDHTYLEECTNMVFQYLQDKDLSFEDHGFWNDWDNRELSLKKHEGGSWIYILPAEQKKIAIRKLPSAKPADVKLSNDEKWRKYHAKERQS